MRIKSIDRRAKKQLKEDDEVQACRECRGGRTGFCSPFTEELMRPISSSQPKKLPGLNGLCNEHLRHLGPVARRALLFLINALWQTGLVPWQWRRAVIVPIPKPGKDQRLLASYRPIALTSHMAKVTERLVASRLKHLIKNRHMIPPEQASFREKRGVEDAIAPLAQQVQDGWQKKPCPRPRNSCRTESRLRNSHS